MTRETKVGLVVAASFMILVGIVIATKLRGGDPTEPEESSPKVAAVANKDKDKGGEPKTIETPKKDPTPEKKVVPLQFDVNSPPRLEIPPPKLEIPPPKLEIPPPNPDVDAILRKQVELRDKEKDKKEIVLIPSAGVNEAKEPPAFDLTKPPPVLPPLGNDPPTTFDPKKDVVLPKLDPLKDKPAPVVDPKDPPLFDPLKDKFVPLDDPKGVPPLDPQMKLNPPPLFDPKKDIPPIIDAKKDSLPKPPNTFVVPGEPKLDALIPPLVSKEQPPAFPLDGKDAKKPGITLTQPEVPPFGINPPPIGGIDVPAPKIESKGLPPVNDLKLDYIQAMPGETTFAQISRRLYGEEKYGDALLAYNRANQGLIKNGASLPALNPGQQLLAPPAALLERDYRNLIVPSIPPNTAPAVRLVPPPTAGNPGVAAVSNPPTGPMRTYVVQTQGGERIRDIALRHLGDRERWTDILRVNQSLNLQPQFPIPAGTQLQLPAN